MEDSDFIFKNYKEQILALNYFIDECYHRLPNQDNSLVRFGGGTALAMYYLGHRRSFDIDLFVTDPQVLVYLSPKHWLEDSLCFNTNNYMEQSNHIRVVSNNKIKVDILVAQDFIAKPIIDTSKRFFSDTIYIESIEDIVSKKIRYRKDKNLSRDIIDLAVVLHKDKNFLNKLLDIGATNKEDLQILSDNLTKLDKLEYNDEVEIVSPFVDFRDISLNAPSIILNNLSGIL